MPELDILVPMPRAIPVAGDNVLYSTRPYVAAGNGRPPVIGPLLSGERTKNAATGTFEANQAATVKLQVWDPVTGAWVTVNGTGDAASASAPFTFDYKLPGGDVQIVANFATPPTTWSVSQKVRLYTKNA